MIRRKAGFTFVEILVVLGVIALLVAIVIPNYLDARTKVRTNTCISNQKIIYTAAVSYVMVEQDSLEAKGHKERLEALVDGGYLKSNGQKWMECPSSGDNDQDDYTLIFEDGFVADIECDVDPANHRWP